VGAQVPIVRVEQGVVTLSGNVMDFRAKNAAARDARCVSGVWRVDDRMTVLPALHESDATIQKQVMGGVYNDATVHDMPNIEITTQGARVTLQGAVASQEEKKEIENDAEEVPGVVAVEDHLQVKGYGPNTHPAEPGALRHRAIESIFWDPRVQAGRVAVAVSPDGDVTLSGVVDSWREPRTSSTTSALQPRSRRRPRSPSPRRGRLHRADSVAPVDRVGGTACPFRAQRTEEGATTLGAGASPGLSDAPLPIATVFSGTGAASKGRINSIGMGKTIVEFSFDPMSRSVCM